MVRLDETDGLLFWNSLSDADDDGFSLSATAATELNPLEGGGRRCKENSQQQPAAQEEQTRYPLPTTRCSGYPLLGWWAWRLATFNEASGSNIIASGSNIIAPPGDGAS